MTLGFKAIAEAIRTRCVDRIIAMPKLLELHYQNGDRFVPDSVAAWAKPVISEGSDTGAVIGTSLLDFDAALAEAKSPRQAALIRLAFCRAAIAEKRTAIASLVLNGLQTDIETLTAAQWDEGLANEVKQLEELLRT